MSYKRWLFVAIALFGIGLIMGLSIPTDVPGGTNDDIVQELAELWAPLPQSQLSFFVFILLKNISALLISFALSPLLALVPVIALTFNGGIIGLVSNLVIEERSLGYLLAGLMPHGIIELPALIIGEAAALSFGVAATLAFFSRERRKLLLPNFKENFRYLSIALALFLPAAIIESFITPLFLN